VVGKLNRSIGVRKYDTLPTNQVPPVEEETGWKEMKKWVT
jgi:hypothetical protein